MSKEEAVAQVQDEDDEPDEWYIVVELPNQDPSSTDTRQGQTDLLYWLCW